MEKFADLGCKVACVDIDEEINRETVEIVNGKHANCAKAYTCDVSFSENVKNLRKAIEEDFGPVNMVIHNAGLIAGGPLIDFDDLYLLGIINVNLTSHFYVSLFSLLYVFCNRHEHIL